MCQLLDHGLVSHLNNLIEIYKIVGIFTEPAHILPFWDNYPDPEQWTDAQLGIPPDDE